LGEIKVSSPQYDRYEQCSRGRGAAEASTNSPEKDHTGIKEKGGKGSVRLGKSGGVRTKKKSVLRKVIKGRGGQD